MRVSHAVGREHFERGALRRSGQRVRVLAEEQRAGDRVLAAVFAHRLHDGEDVRFVEAALERAAAMAAGAERDALRRIVRVRHIAIGAQKRRHVHQHFGEGRFSGQWVGHAVPRVERKIVEVVLALLSPIARPGASASARSEPAPALARNPARSRVIEPKRRG